MTLLRTKARQLNKPSIRFLLGGAFIAGLAFALTGLLQWLGLPFQVAFAVAYVTCIGLQFLLHRLFTFAGPGEYALKSQRQAAWFFTLAAVHYTFIALGTAVLAPLLDVPPLAVYFVLAAVAALVNFLVLSLGVFKRGHRTIEIGHNE